MNKKLISILAVGMMIALAANAAEVVDWGVNSGTANISESGGTMTLTVDAATITTLTPTTIAGTATVSAGAITGTSLAATPSSGAGTATITGTETNNADLVLDADDGDDNADTWTIRSATADNNLDILNHTTVAADLTSAGVLSVLGGIDAIGAVDLDIGSADVTDVTIVTDGTGDGEVVLPTGSISTGEILDNTIVAADVANGVFGGSADLYTDYGTVTSTADALQTNSFNVTFGSAPVVICTYTEDPGDVRPIFITSTSTTNFVASVTADKNFQWIAIGPQ